jgi:hypothetical protein
MSLQRHHHADKSASEDNQQQRTCADEVNATNSLSNVKGRKKE